MNSSADGPPATHLQLEALLTAGRHSENQYDFALICLLGLLGRRVFESHPVSTSPISAKNIATGFCASSAKAARRSSFHFHRPSAELSTRQSADVTPDQSCSTPVAPAWTGMPPPVACASWLLPPGCGRMPPIHPHMLRHTYVTTMLDAGVDLRDVQIAARHADPRTTMRYDIARNQLDRHPNYILAAYMASGT